MNVVKLLLRILVGAFIYSSEVEMPLPQRVIDGVAGATFTKYFGEILSDIRTAIL